MLSFERSILLNANYKEMLVEIQHREPWLVQEILLIDADARQQQVKSRYEIGAETDNSINGIPMRSAARWQGEELVIESWLGIGDGGPYFRDHWSLSNDHQILTMAHRDDALAGQISVFARVLSDQTGNSTA